MAFMLSGIGSQLNQRRYQDATNSLVDYLQGQYNLVANVNNSRTNISNDQLASACTNANSPSVAGTSDCTVVGRILHGGVAAGGDTTNITSTWVVATADVATLQSGIGDSAVLRAANLVQAVVDSDADTYELQWGTRLVKASAHDQALTFTILIVRIPTTGVVRTYVNTALDMKPADVVSTDNLTSDFKLCVDPVGLLNASADPAGALIQQAAANSSGVQSVGQGDCT